MKTLEQLQQQKEYWGFLEGQDSQDYLAYIRGTRTDWTEEAQQELTSFMLGLPVKEGYAFEIIAGVPAPEIKRKITSETVKTMKERIRHKRVLNAARQACLRKRKIAL